MIPQNIMDELLAEQDRQIKILKDGIYQKVIAEKDRQIKIQNDHIQDLQYLVGLYRRMYGSKKKCPSSACKGKVVLFYPIKNRSMKTKRRHSDREVASAARRAVEMTVYWADVEIVDDVITGRLVVRPCTD